MLARSLAIRKCAGFRNEPVAGDGANHGCLVARKILGKRLKYRPIITKMRGMRHFVDARHKVGTREAGEQAELGTRGNGKR